MSQQKLENFNREIARKTERATIIIEKLRDFNIPQADGQTTSFASDVRGKFYDVLGKAIPRRKEILKSLEEIEELLKNQKSQSK